MFRKIVINIAMITAVTIIASSCGSSDSKKEEPVDQSGTNTGSGTGGTSTVTMTGSLAIQGTALTSVDQTLYCVTFEAAPSAASTPFGSDGSFSLRLPRSVNFGCFVTETASKKNIGTFVIGGSGGGLGSGNTSSFALDTSVDLGNLTLGSNGLVVIPASAIASAVYTPASTGIDIDQMHNAAYTMTCVDSNNAENLAACKEMLLEDQADASVFFRVLKGTETNGDPVQGLGVWRDQAGFAGCGGFDINQEMTEKDGSTLTLSQGTVGEWTGADCVERDPGPGKVKSNLHDYYLISELVKTGAGYSVRDEDEVDQGGGCTTYHSTAIEFSGSTAEFIGAFSLMHTRNGCSDSEDAYNLSFLVKFVKN